MTATAACAVQGAAVVTAGQLLQHTSHFILARLPRPGPSHTPSIQDASEGTRAEFGASTGAEEAQEVSSTKARRFVPRQATTSYAVPQGGGFEWVSCPHYLGEIVIYVGLALASQGTALALLVLAWVVRPTLPRRLRAASTLKPLHAPELCERVV